MTPGMVWMGLGRSVRAFFHGGVGRRECAGLDGAGSADDEAAGDEAVGVAPLLGDILRRDGPFFFAPAARLAGGGGSAARWFRCARYATATAPTRLLTPRRTKISFTWFFTVKKLHCRTRAIS